MNKKSKNKPDRILRALTKADLIFVQSGFPIEQRTVFGLHGDLSDLAISLKWHDGAGCEWEADFTEDNLANASVSQNQITLDDSGGEKVCLELHGLKPERV